MGTGFTTLLWYGLCIGFVVLTVFVGIGLFAWGTRKEKRRRRSPPPS